jgi:hypothetical protein
MRWHRRHIRDTNELKRRLAGQSTFNVQRGNITRHYMEIDYPQNISLHDQPHLLRLLCYKVSQRQMSGPINYSTDANNIIREIRRNNCIASPVLLLLRVAR